MKNAFFYFIICPFIGFIQAIKNYRSSWAKPTIIAFVAFFGMSMVKSDAVDSSRDAQKLEIMYSADKSFENLEASFYNEDGSLDIYTPIVTFIFSLYTDNAKFLFLFYGLVFGYFYVNNIWMILNQSKGKLPWEQFLVLATFTMVIGFWNLNGVRMWTAAHIFFYGGFSYLYLNRKIGLLIAASSALIHFSMLLPFGLLLVYSFSNINYRLLYIFYIISFFILELNIGIVKSFVETYVPDFMVPKVKSYLDEEYIEKVITINDKGSWYITYYIPILSYFNLIFVTLIFFKAKLSLHAKKLFGFALLFLAVANITSLLPSGSRYLLIALMFSVALSFIVLINSSKPIFTKSIKLMSPVLVLFCIVSIRILLDYFNITTLTNPIVVLFTNIEVPIIDFIK